MRFTTYIGFFLALCCGSMGSAQEELEFSFFKSLWDGRSGMNIPPDMANPRDLRQSFLHEPKNISWAFDAERRINAAIDDIKVGKITARRVQCRATICEIIFVVPADSVADGQGGQAALSEAINRNLGGAALALGKDFSMAFASPRSERKFGVLIYLYDRAREVGP